MKLQRFTRQGRVRGFTLIELMIAVAVAAILAAVAIPQYTQYVARGRVVEAHGQLTGWATTLQQYYQDNRAYPTQCTSGAGLTMKPADSTYFTYSCPTATATTFVIQATGKTGTNLAGLQYTLDQSGTRATPAVPTGWTANTGSCWVRTQSGSCN